MRMTLLVGGIACGKSTYAARRARDGALVVNDDAIVLLVHGGVYELHAAALKPLYVQIETAVITAAALTGRDVVIDRGCRSLGCRTRLASLGRSLGFRVGYVEFPWASPEEHADRRYRHDSRGLSAAKWLQIAHHHAATFDPVLPGENLEVH